ncbi:MAG: hypothetical protein ACJ8GM_02410 [Paraburkholderia fungorum]
MTPEDEREILSLMREARKKDRGYANFFSWSIDRDLEELGVVKSLHEVLARAGAAPFTDIASRGRGEDPPDCEARNASGQRVAIEVTELVNGKAIAAFKQGDRYAWASWTRDEFLTALAELIQNKDKRFPKLKGAPYPGGYVVVVHCDESELSAAEVAAFIEGAPRIACSYITQAYLLLSYDPALECCPHFLLRLIKTPPAAPSEGNGNS